MKKILILLILVFSLTIPNAYSQAVPRVCFDASIEFDQKKYSLEDKFIVILSAPNANLDPKQIDMVEFFLGSDIDDLYEELVFVETGPDTGIFSVGSLLISDFVITTPNKLNAIYLDICDGVRTEVRTTVEINGEILVELTPTEPTPVEIVPEPTPPPEPTTTIPSEPTITIPREPISTLNPETVLVESAEPDISATMYALIGIAAAAVVGILVALKSGFLKNAKTNLKDKSEREAKMPNVSIKTRIDFEQ